MYDRPNLIANEPVSVAPTSPPAVEREATRLVTELQMLSEAADVLIRAIGPALKPEPPKSAQPQTGMGGLAVCSVLAANLHGLVEQVEDIRVRLLDAKARCEL